MSMPKIVAQAERIEARVTPELKALIERAAHLQGRTLEDFIVTSLEAEAEGTISGHATLRIEVSQGAYEQVLAAIENPPPPNEARREAYRDYLDFIGDAEHE